MRTYVELGAGFAGGAGLVLVHLADDNVVD